MRRSRSALGDVQPAQQLVQSLNQSVTASAKARWMASMTPISKMTSPARGAFAGGGAAERRLHEPSDSDCFTELNFIMAIRRAGAFQAVPWPASRYGDAVAQGPRRDRAARRHNPTARRAPAPPWPHITRFTRMNSSPPHSSPHRKLIGICEIELIERTLIAGGLICFKTASPPCAQL